MTSEKKSPIIKHGVFSFSTTRPVTDKEGRDLEIVLMAWALRNGMRIGCYWYETK